MAKAAKKLHIVLTGAGRGLGLAMVHGFSERGHIVWGCSQSADRVAELQRRWSEPHDFSQVDVRHDDQVQAWAGRVLATIGPPDLLLNNAAVVNRNAPLWKVSDEEFTQVMDVNVRGVVNVLRHFVPAMIERQAGVIVNFSSGWGRSTSPEVAPYCASKFAIEGLTRALAEELPSGMAAIPLNPGIIDTDMLRSCFGASAASYPSPDAWARKAVPFLLNLGPSDNGESLSVE
jgi:NAD(P)-dependent dehydrogenase (short-subunit alcohol dehydrogenase family)